MEQAPLLSNSQRINFENLSKQLADPNVVFVVKAKLPGFTMPTGTTRTLLYYLCDQRMFGTIYWLTTTETQVKLLVGDFEELLLRFGDKRQLIKKSPRHVTLREEDGSEYSIKFISGGLKFMRGLSAIDALIIIDRTEPAMNDPFWLPYIANNTRFVCKWGVPEEEMHEEMLKVTRFIRL